jgi:hypothetical protein
MEFLYVTPGEPRQAGNVLSCLPVLTCTVVMFGGHPRLRSQEERNVTLRIVGAFSDTWR